MYVVLTAMRLSGNVTAATSAEEKHAVRGRRTRPVTFTAADNHYAEFGSPYRAYTVRQRQ